MVIRLWCRTDSRVNYFTYSSLIFNSVGLYCTEEKKLYSKWIHLEMTHCVLFSSFEIKRCIIALVNINWRSIGPSQTLLLCREWRGEILVIQSSHWGFWRTNLSLWTDIQSEKQCSWWGHCRFENHAFPHYCGVTEATPVIFAKRFILYYFFL